MVSYREFVQAFRELGLNNHQPVIVHASLSSLGEIRGGLDVLIGALLQNTAGVMAPAFTYKTMLIPEDGPANNAISYGTGKDQNRMAEFFHPDMPCDPSMGMLPEAIRKHSQAKRSGHPILSFTGIRVTAALETQSIQSPLAPIGALAEQNGMVLLIGVNHTVNTAIHYAERLAGRKQFVRWALTPQGVRACPGFPGCSDGFQQAAPHLQKMQRSTSLGGAVLTSVPLRPMLQVLQELIRCEPLALLCGKHDGRCEAVRSSVLQMEANE